MAACNWLWVLSFRAFGLLENITVQKNNKAKSPRTKEEEKIKLVGLYFASQNLFSQHKTRFKFSQEIRRRSDTGVLRSSEMSSTWKIVSCCKVFFWRARCTVLQYLRTVAPLQIQKQISFFSRTNACRNDQEKQIQEIWHRSNSTDWLTHPHLGGIDWKTSIFSGNAHSGNTHSKL